MRITYKGLRSGNTRVAIISYAENEEIKAYEIARKFTIATSYKVDTLVHGMLIIEVDDMNDFNNVKEWYKQFKTNVSTNDTKDTDSDTTETVNNDTNETAETDNNEESDTQLIKESVDGLYNIFHKELINRFVDGINNGLENDNYKQTRECFEKVVQILPDGYEICFTTKFNIDMTKVDEPIYNHRYKIIRDKTGLMFTIHKYSEVYHKFKPLKPETKITDIIRYIYYRTFDNVCCVFKRE